MTFKAVPWGSGRRGAITEIGRKGGINVPRRGRILTMSTGKMSKGKVTLICFKWWEEKSNLNNRK